MAKKKKAAANPARGFATTSVASKPKQEKAADADVRDSSKAVAPSPETTLQTSSHVEASGAATGPTPEDLEAQLERDELQLLVEKYASKARRESGRHVSKLRIDQRVLRPQAQPATTHNWLSMRVLNAIISLAQTESNDSNRKQGQQSLLKTLSEEDAISKLWTLDLTLRGLGFSHDYIQSVLRWLCANAATADSTASIWGFQEAFEWLALDHCEGFHFPYEEQKVNSLPVDSPGISRPNTPVANRGASAISTANATTSSTPAEADTGHLAISDLDSDIEPDQLVPTYLKIKGRLFELDPDAVDTQPRRQTKARKGQSQSSATRKLLAQLQQLEADALFDQNEAESKWPAKRNQIAQAKAEERKLQAFKPRDRQEKLRSNSPTTEIQTSESSSKDTQISIEDGDTDLLGNIFAATPDEPPTSGSNIEHHKEDVILRDFGKQGGLPPKRLLEEAARSRDSGVRLSFKLVSPTTYSCRHSLTITWSKYQDIQYENDITGATFKDQKLQVTFTATNVATVSIEQSEGFVSTAALFSILAASKDDKTYLRLPSNWRDLYREFLDRRKERIDSEDRETIKRLQSLIQDQLQNEESEDIVLTNRFKMRNQATRNSSVSGSGRNTPVPVDEALTDLWKQKSSTACYQRMLLLRINLPVFEFRTSILSAIDQHQVTIICGETGCGKSTQIPSFILEHQLSRGIPCKVYCTEPRRISAISLAQRVSEELGEGPRDLGTTRSIVGYAIRLETKVSSQTRLVYATVGVVLRMLESSGKLDEITHLIIDEVHERNIDTDFLLIILRSLMLDRPELKVILMSATVDADRFSKYLNDAPVLNVPGRTYPVQTNYLEDAIELANYSISADLKADGQDTSGDEEMPVKEKSGIPAKLPGYSGTTRNVLLSYDEYGIDYDLILRLIETIASDPQLSAYSKAFLVFLPGIAEIRQLNDMILGHPSFEKHWVIYPLHSTISSEDQQTAFLIPPPGMRKIVIATNIAETGVTIPDITCVIDTGKHKEMRFDERRQLSRLTQSFISRANAKQRRGRAGRVQDGLCFHLFTKYRHDNLMTDQQTPEMLRLSLQELVMRTKICKLGEIEKTLLEALDPPSQRNIRRAIDALIEVDALTPDEELTPLGRQIARLPLDAHLGKLVLLSCMFGCVDAAITIAAILSSKSPFITPFGAKQRADIAHMAFKAGDSDLLTAYHAYKSWKTVCTTSGRSEVQFCHKNFLSSQNLGNVEDLKSQILSSLVEVGFIQLSPEDRRTLNRYRNTSRHRMFVSVPIQYDTNSENYTLVNSVIAAAFYPKILIREGKGWRNILNNQTVHLSPTSVNKATTINPSATKFLSYYHIMQTSNKYYNAHSTSIAYPLPIILLVGADIDFKLHAGVVGLPGNVLRFVLEDWRAATALKILRRRIKEILAASWKSPGRQFSTRESEWLGLFFQIFQQKQEEEEKVKERVGGLAK